MLCLCEEQLYTDTMCLREKLAKGREENKCKTLIPACFSVCLFQHKFSPYARFPPERKMVCMRSLSSSLSTSCPCGHTSLYILTSLFWKPDCFKAEINSCFPFAMKILEGTIAASFNSNRALAVKASWCSFSRIPVEWLFEFRLGNGFTLRVDCGTQCE